MVYAIPIAQVDTSQYCDLFQVIVARTFHFPFQIIAIDRDAGQNGLVSYSIAFGNKGNVFSVGPANGILTNIGIIDREAISSYTLQIAASDGM